MMYNAVVFYSNQMFFTDVLLKSNQRTVDPGELPTARAVRDKSETECRPVSMCYILYIIHSYVYLLCRLPWCNNIGNSYPKRVRNRRKNNKQKDRPSHHGLG